MATLVPVKERKIDGGEEQRIIIEGEEREVKRIESIK